MRVVHHFVKTARFIAALMKKHVAFHFTSSRFFLQFVERKVVGSVSKFSLIAGDTHQVYPASEIYEKTT